MYIKKDGLSSATIILKSNIFPLPGAISELKTT